jgi:hypothetical protein
MNVKFVRGLLADIPTGNSYSGPILFHLKLLYEFWGFCIHGSDDLRAPGGFATISGSLAPNYLKLPTNFESGSAVLLASGSDGSTTLGGDIFTAPSINWTSGSLVNKYLVTWKSGSTSTDDSIYPITQIISSSSIKVDTNTGGTPFVSTSNKPFFTDRSSINFRVVDISAASQLPGLVAGNEMILQFAASDINPGQLNSQARLRVFDGTLTLSSITVSVSPSGSWNGSSHSDLSSNMGAEAYATNEYGFIEGFDTVVTTGGLYQFSIFADKAGFIFHKNQNQNSVRPGTPSYFHVEVPTRIYPPNIDPNPVAYINIGRKGLNAAYASTTANPSHYSQGWIVADPVPNANRRYSFLIRDFSGLSSTFYSGNFMGALNNSRVNQAFYNLQTKTFFLQDAYLAHHRSTTNFNLGRVKLRLAKYYGGAPSTYTKLGKDGKWLYIKHGIIWPWDNANLDYPLFRYGI